MLVTRTRSRAARGRVTRTPHVSKIRRAKSARKTARPRGALATYWKRIGVGLITLAACGGPADEEEDAICLLPDGAEVPCDWTCLTEAGSVVHCDSEKAARACYCSGPTGLTYPMDCSAGPVEGSP